MDREEVSRLRRDLEVIQQVSGLGRKESPFNVRLFGLSLALLGCGFMVLSLWHPDWVSYGIFCIVAFFIGVTFWLVKAGLPSFSRAEMVQMFTWVGSLFAICLVFAIWGVMLGLPPRVLCGAEMFISGVFPLPMSIAARDSRTWVCGLPLMAGGLALPFVALPMGAVIGLGVILSGFAYALAQGARLKKECSDAD